MYLIYDTPLWY